MTQEPETETIQAAPAAVDPGTCPAGHPLAYRSQIEDGQLKMITFCPACEGSGIPPAADASN